MTDPQPSSVGNLTDLQQGQILLPGFVQRLEGRLHIDLAAIDSRALITQFVERVFSAGAYFSGLDYDLFLKLLFAWEPADIARELERFERAGRSPLVFLARDIVAFRPERQAFYRGLKIDGNGEAAEYLFEQLTVERPAPPGPNGEEMPPVVERAFLDFDEFVAELWMKGLRFGIDAALVRDAIARDKTERLTVAVKTPPTEGSDASIDEQTDLLHRDDSPRLRNDGRMDLRHYRNRFPQVAVGTRLFKKVPRVLGVSGWNVAGRELPPAAVKDFDIQTLAGPGTEVVRDANGEFVVAARDGFLDIDTQSGMLSVVDKIVNRDGVSMRTTGDLMLSGDEFEEHGEVQEQRVVEGHNMTFLADVFGIIRSDGGCITFKQKIGGGEANSPRGTIVVEGVASCATLDARSGEVVVAYAESCLILAARVRIEHAVRCDIVADEVTIANAEGCGIAAKRVAIASAAARKDEPTAVTMLMPDMEAFALGERALTEARAEAEAHVAKIEGELKAFAVQPEMKTYLSLQPRIKAGALTMSPKQTLQWQELLSKLAPTLRQYAARSAALQEARDDLVGIDEQLAESTAARTAALADISCAIVAVAGETLVRKRQQSFLDTPLARLSPKDLHTRLHEAGGIQARLFFADTGSFEWNPGLDLAAEGD